MNVRSAVLKQLKRVPCLLAFLAIVALTTPACTKKSETPTATSPTLAQVDPASFAGKTLHVYSWSNYFNPTTVESFEKKTGAKVEFSYFSSNEELVAKLQAGAKGYDIIVPSSYFLGPLKGLNLLKPLGEDVSAWPETKEILPRFKALKADPHFEYALPLSWGTTGLAVRKDLVAAGKVDGWAWLFDHPELKGKITMLEDPAEVIGAALKYLGYSANATSPEALEKAKALLKKQKPWLKAYTTETQPLLLQGEVAIAHAFSCDAGQSIAKNPSVVFIQPKEGSLVWADYMALAKDSAEPALAKAFMRHLLQAAAQAGQVRHIYVNPVAHIEGAKEGVEALDLLKRFNLAVAEADLNDAKGRYEFTSDDPELHERFQRLWTELKAE